MTTSPAADGDAPSGQRSGMAGFFASRWRGEARLGTIVWRDMVFIGTILNLAVALLSLLVLGLKGPLWLGLALYFAPVPYNLFLLIAAWRAADRGEEPNAGVLKLVALAWFVLASMI